MSGDDTTNEEWILAGKTKKNRGRARKLMQMAEDDNKTDRKDTNKEENGNKKIHPSKSKETTSRPTITIVRVGSKDDKVNSIQCTNKEENERKMMQMTEDDNKTDGKGVNKEVNGHENIQTEDDNKTDGKGANEGQNKDKKVRSSKRKVTTLQPTVTADSVGNKDSYDGVKSIHGQGELKSEGDTCMRSTGESKKTFRCEGGMKACGLALKEEEHFIKCDMCKLRFHLTCQSISTDAFRAYTEHKFMWLCMKCKPKFEEMTEVGKFINSRLEETEEKILSALNDVNMEELEIKIKNRMEGVLKSMMEQLSNQQSKIEANLKEHKELSESMPKYAQELKKTADDLKKIEISKEDYENRSCNLILHNIPESESQTVTEKKKCRIVSSK